MKLFTPLLLLLIVSCKTEPQGKIVSWEENNTVAAASPVQTIESANLKMEQYFGVYAIEPYILINNVHLSDQMGALEGQDVVHLGKYTIKWINTEQETKIQIGNDLFTLKGVETLNITEASHKDDVDFANNWKQVRLYSIGKDDLIVITMVFHPCVGRGCGIEYTLVYDVNSKARNFFGSFRGTNTSELYGFRDGKLRYISNTYQESSNAESHIKELYELNNDGTFSQNTDTEGRAYFIKYTNNDDRSSDFEEYWLASEKDQLEKFIK